MPQARPYAAKSPKTFERQTYHRYLNTDRLQTIIKGERFAAFPEIRK